MILMNRSFQISWWIVLFCFTWISSAQAGALLADLENALMCKCDDSCGKVLINCTCDTADETRKILEAKLESGLTVEKIIQSYVDRYGETVLSAPTKTGFNLTAWLTPFAALFCGGFGIQRIIKNWVRRRCGVSESTSTFNMPEERNRYTRKLQKELDNLDI